MSDGIRRGAKEGLGFGIAAGVIFAAMEVVGATLMGDPPLMPFRMFASVLLGHPETIPMGTALIVGSLAHLALSAVFGLVYGAVNGRLSDETQTSWGRQAVGGLVYGTLLWFVNFQVIARAVYPWFLMSPQFLQAMMHAVFFGLPLGLMYAGAERRIHHGHPTPSPA